MANELTNKEIAQALRDFGIKPSLNKADGTCDYTETVYELFKRAATHAVGASAGDVLRLMEVSMNSSYFERYVLIHTEDVPGDYAKLQLCCYEHDPVYVKIPTTNEDWKKINTELENLVFGIHGTFINNCVEVPLPPPKYISEHTHAKDFGKDYALRIYLHNANVPAELRTQFDERGARITH